MKLALAIWGILFFGTPSFAQDSEQARFNEALRLVRAGDLAQASHLMKTLVVAHREKNLYWFNLGTIEAMRGNHEYAIRVFGRIVIVKSPLAPAARLYMAKSYRELGKNEEALRILRELEREALPPGLRAEVTADLGELSDNVVRPRSTDPYWLMVDSSLGYTSNAFADGRSVTGVASLLTRLGASGGYHFLKGEEFSLKASYALNYEEPFSARELRTLSQNMQVPLLFEKSNSLTQAVPYVQWQAWAGSPVSEKTGVAFRYSQWNDQYDFGIDGDISGLRSTSTSYPYLSGSFYSMKPFVGFFAKDLYGQIALMLGKDGTQDIVYGDSSSLPLEHVYQGLALRAIWRPTEVSVLNFSLVSLQKNFVSLSVPSLKKRTDRELTVSVKYSHGLQRKLSVFGVGEWTSNTSTLSAGDVRDKNFEILVFMAGLNWELF